MGLVKTWKPKPPAASMEDTASQRKRKASFDDDQKGKKAKHGDENETEMMPGRPYQSTSLLGAVAHRSVTPARVKALELFLDDDQDPTSAADHDDMSDDLELTVAYRLESSIAAEAKLPAPFSQLLPHCNDSYHSSFKGFKSLIGSEEDDLSQTEYAEVQRLLKFPTGVHRSNGLGLSRPFWHLISDFNIISRQQDADTLRTTDLDDDDDCDDNDALSRDDDAAAYTTTAHTPKNKVAQMEMFKCVSNVIHYYITSANIANLPLENVALPGGTLQLMMSPAGIDTIAAMKKIGYSWASIKKQAQHSANYLQRGHEAFRDFQRRFASPEDARAALKCGDQSFVGLPTRLDLDDQCRRFKKLVSQSKSKIDKQTAERKAKTKKQLQEEGVMPLYKDWLQVVAYCNNVVDSWACEEASAQERQWVAQCYSLLLYNECLGSRPAVLPNITWGCFVSEPTTTTFHIKFSAPEKVNKRGEFYQTTQKFVDLTKRMLTLSWYGTKPRYHLKEPGKLSDNNKASMGAEKLLKKLDKASGVRDDAATYDPASLRTALKKVWAKAVPTEEAKGRSKKKKRGVLNPCHNFRGLRR